MLRRGSSQPGAHPPDSRLYPNRGFLLGYSRPPLSQRYHVIVPDCRGHGQSANPTHSYSFKELAADAAGLVRALGYTRAHIIGHSNGGNVALVTLVEYPEIVQTAVLQAANAYVSSDLIEKEPAILRSRARCSGSPCLER